jgi:hypothetical protein
MAPKAQNHLLEFYKKIEFPFHTLLYIALIVAIIYGQQIPDSIKVYGPNPIYRILAFVLVLAVTKYISPYLGLLLALVIVLYVSYTPGSNGEGYQNSLIAARNQRRWFDEEILGENPTSYQNDRVTTQAPNT